MPGISWLFNFFRRYSRRTDDVNDGSDSNDTERESVDIGRYALDGVTGTKTLITDGDADTPQIDINIFCSEVLHDKHGRTPEEMAAMYLGENLDRHDQSYRIRYNFDSYDAVEESSGVPNDTIRQFLADLRDGERPRASNANLLLVDSEGGGASLHGASTCPAAFLDHRQELRQLGTDEYLHNIHDIMHEFAHCMGLGHDMDADEEGNQHTGEAYNDNVDEVWVRTPTVAGNNVRNLCGTPIPKRQYHDARWDLRFTDCDVEHFDYDIEDRI